MARQAKRGLEYFPLDVDLFSDIKIRKLIKYQSGKAVTVYAHLLCNIYKEGYYLVWDDELPFIISESTGFEEVYIQEVIKNCLNIGLFSKPMFDTHRVLTSASIQRRYDYIAKLLKKRASIEEYKVDDVDKEIIVTERMPIITETIPQLFSNAKKQAKNDENEQNFPEKIDEKIEKNPKNNGEFSIKNPIVTEVMPIVTEVMPIVTERKPILNGKSTQSKVKESKVKEIKEKSNKKEKKLYDFVSPDFEIFYEYLEYRLKQHKFTYSTDQYVQDAYNELLKLSNNDPKTAVEVVKQSISRGWKGLFELKTGQSNANNGKFSNNGGQLSDYEKRRRLTVDEVETSRAKLIEAMQNGTVKIGFGSGD